MRAVFGVLAVALLGWMTWVTLNIASYVSGEARGERLSTTEAALMIETSNTKMRSEWVTDLKEIDRKITEINHKLDTQAR